LKRVTLDLHGSNTSFALAPQGKRVCKWHGGRSTGPKTEAGRQRCAEAKTIHGRETRKARTERSLASARLAVLEAVGFGIGLIKGPRTRGVRSNRMAEAYPELQEAVRRVRLKDPISKLSEIEKN